MVGIDKDSGEAVWEVKTADNDLMESHTGAPLVINNLAINIFHISPSLVRVAVNVEVDKQSSECSSLIRSRDLSPFPITAVGEGRRQTPFLIPDVLATEP